MIGYYAHHVGQGHVRHLRAIAAHSALPVTGLSSLPTPAGWDGEWVRLPADDAVAAPIDPSAHGALHWVPAGDPGLRGRMAAIARWIEVARPAVLVVDVSVEVALFGRLMGIPVVVMALPGDRTDPAHRLAYSVADTIIAPWPAGVPELDSSIAPWRDRVVHVGGISANAGRSRWAAPNLGRPRVVVLNGAGGGAVTARQLDEAATATPDWSWQRIGPDSWVDDPWPIICGADVVVTHAGLGAVADVAEARRPAVVIPQPRPHDEQVHTARALAAGRFALAVPAWPGPASWHRYLNGARALGGEQWAEWCVPGPRRAADAIAAVAHGAAVAAG